MPIPEVNSRDYYKIRGLNSIYRDLTYGARWAAYIIPGISVGMGLSQGPAITFAAAVAAGKILKGPLSLLEQAFDYKAIHQGDTIEEIISSNLPKTKNGKIKWAAKTLTVAAAWAVAAGGVGYELEKYIENSRIEEAAEATKQKAEKAKETARIATLPELPANAIAQPTNRQYYCQSNNSGYKEVRIQGIKMKLNCGE